MRLLVLGAMMFSAGRLVYLGGCRQFGVSRLDEKATSAIFIQGGMNGKAAG